MGNNSSMTYDNDIEKLIKKINANQNKIYIK
jgi:hypothetical protein